MRPNFRRAPPALSLILVCVSLPTVSSVARLAPLCVVVRRFGKGVLVLGAGDRKQFFYKIVFFLKMPI